MRSLSRTANAASSAQQKSMNSHKSEKPRIDVLMVERGLAPSRERAQALIMAGQVLSEGQRIDKPGTRIAKDARIEITGQALRYASRGGLKLEGALEDFALSPGGRICLDAGSSTGGFTDCLLQNGAAKVYAVDVTVSQLDWKLQQHNRVVMIERNARHLQAADIADPIAFITADLSFISVAKVLPALVSVAAPGGDLLVLIKPQFELEKRDVGKGGIVRDPAFHQKAVQGIVEAAARLGLQVEGVKPSKLPGAEGNQEFFLHARKGPLE
jgi:23S rRNA (cytidine1920-2'-O)/16S rRNA (cytidine1409-2'-O)-methyltransferase